MTAMEEGNPSAHELRNRLVGQTAARPERLPGLLELFESFAAEFGRYLSPLLADSPYCKLNGVEPAVLAEALSLIHAPRVAALQAAEIDARAFLVFEGAFDWVLIDAIFGAAPGSLGRGQSASKPTRIGDRLLIEVASMAAQALGAAFSKICPLPFKLDRMLDDKGFPLESHQAPMIAAKLTIRIKSRECSVALLMPQSILSQMRSALAEPQTKSTRESDPVWSLELDRAVGQTPLEVSAVVEELKLTLGQVANLTVGQSLPLRGAGVGRVRLVCNEHELFSCRIS
jgi:flagellar motor switch protein FliM